MSATKGNGLFGRIFGNGDTPDESTETTNTPTNEVVVPTEVSVYKAGDESNQYLPQFNKMYDEGFKSLNKDGVDFFELYESVSETGIDDPDEYVRTLRILSNIDKTITKDFLVKDGNYYLERVHEQYEKHKGKGELKREELVNEKKTEKTTLETEILELQKEYNRVYNTLNEKKGLHKTLNERYDSKLNEIDGKLKANDIARNRIIAKIRKVIINFKQFIKE